MNSPSSPTQVICRTRSAGVSTETTVDLGHPIVSTSNHYQIIATNAAVRFYINGAWVATHTTNIPPDLMRVYFNTASSPPTRGVVSISNVHYGWTPRGS
jgi:hypothetical protein